MVSLVDVMPQTRTVKVAGGELVLHGLSLRQIGELFLQFPMLRNLFTEGAPELNVIELAMAPEAIATVIACTADQPDAAEHVATSGALTLDEVIDCLTAIRDITFPRGVAPLLARLTMLAGELVAGLPGRDQAMSAPPAPNGSLPQGMTQRA